MTSVTLTAEAAPEVLEFDCGVRAYPPARPDGYWRLRWIEEGRRRDTTARSRDEALARAAELVGGLARGRPTDWARAPGSALVAHYLDPPADPCGAGDGRCATGRSRRPTAGAS